LYLAILSCLPQHSKHHCRIRHLSLLVQLSQPGHYARIDALVGFKESEGAFEYPVLEIISCSHRLTLQCEVYPLLMEGILGIRARRERSDLAVIKWRR
jgi:hypothetical protein